MEMKSYESKSIRIRDLFGFLVGNVGHVSRGVLEKVRLILNGKIGIGADEKQQELKHEDFVKLRCEIVTEARWSVGQPW